jgi:hypothetical protein
VAVIDTAFLVDFVLQGMLPVAAPGFIRADHVGRRWISRRCRLGASRAYCD